MYVLSCLLATDAESAQCGCPPLLVEPSVAMIRFSRGFVLVLSREKHQKSREFGTSDFGFAKWVHASPSIFSWLSRNASGTSNSKQETQAADFLEMYPCSCWAIYAEVKIQGWYKKHCLVVYGLPYSWNLRSVPTRYIMYIHLDQKIINPWLRFLPE